MAVAVDGGVRLDVVQTAALQLDVVAAQRGQPAAVVLQRALAGGRVVGDDLGRQFLCMGSPSSWLVIPDPGENPGNTRDLPGISRYHRIGLGT